MAEPPAERLAPTPQALREQAQRAAQLADGVFDEQARTILLDFAEELLERAAALDAARPGGNQGKREQRSSKTDH